MMKSRDSEWGLITNYDVDVYACGLRAGERVRLKKPLVIRDHTGAPTGVIHPAGEIWTVLHGSSDDPGTVWFREPDGDRHTWDDDVEQISEWFERVDPTS